MEHRDSKGRFIKGEKPHNWHQGIHKYRITVEKYLQRKLTDKEVVHHIDGDRKNNSIENLVVFPDNASHLRFHLAKYKQVSVLHEPKIIGEVVSKRDSCGQLRKYEVRKCYKCNKLFWANHYGSAKNCGKRHYPVCKKKIIKICKQCKKPFYTSKEKSLFCNKDCYWKHKKQNFYNGSFNEGHKPYNYWLGKKRTEETKQKISLTKRNKNGNNK